MSGAETGIALLPVILADGVRRTGWRLGCGCAVCCLLTDRGGVELLGSAVLPLPRR